MIDQINKKNPSIPLVKPSAQTKSNLSRTLNYTLSQKGTYECGVRPGSENAKVPVIVNIKLKNNVEPEAKKFNNNFVKNEKKIKQDFCNVINKNELIERLSINNILNLRNFMEKGDVGIMKNKEVFSKIFTEKQTIDLPDQENKTYSNQSVKNEKHVDWLQPPPENSINPRINFNGLKEEPLIERINNWVPPTNSSLWKSATKSTSTTNSTDSETKMMERSIDKKNSELIVDLANGDSDNLDFNQKKKKFEQMGIISNSNFNAHVLPTSKNMKQSSQEKLLKSKSRKHIDDFNSSSDISDGSFEKSEPNFKQINTKLQRRSSIVNIHVHTNNEADLNIKRRSSLKSFNQPFSGLATKSFSSLAFNKLNISSHSKSIGDLYNLNQSKTKLNDLGNIYCRNKISKVKKLVYPPPPPSSNLDSPPAVNIHVHANDAGEQTLHVITPFQNVNPIIPNEQMQEFVPLGGALFNIVPQEDENMGLQNKADLRNSLNENKSVNETKYDVLPTEYYTLKHGNHNFHSDFSFKKPIEYDPAPVHQHELYEYTLEPALRKPKQNTRKKSYRSNIRRPLEYFPPPPPSSSSSDNDYFNEKLNQPLEYFPPAPSAPPEENFYNNNSYQNIDLKSHRNVVGNMPQQHEYLAQINSQFYADPNQNSTQNYQKQQQYSYQTYIPNKSLTNVDYFNLPQQQQNQLYVVHPQQQTDYVSQPFNNINFIPQSHNANVLNDSGYHLLRQNQRTNSGSYIFIPPQINNGYPNGMVNNYNFSVAPQHVNV